MSPRHIRSVDDARTLLLEIGAPERLIRHGLLVTEAADVLLRTMTNLSVTVDEDLVRAGAMLHDSGKTLFPSELAIPGARHEEAGQALLLERGIDPAIARCCVSHARWSSMPCSLEELLVALADKLWKGVRNPDLEQRVIAGLATRLGTDPWSLFVDLDTTFEKIADEGNDRLARSASPR